PSSRRGIRHAAVPEERIDLRLAPAEGAERLGRGAAAADGENLVAEARAGARIEHALRVPGRIARFLERAERIRRQDLRPLVAVVARRIAACEDVAEAVRE